MNDAVQYLLENKGIDNIIEAHRSSNFTEMICKKGGDIITYRVYGNKKDGFMITER